MPSSTDLARSLTRPGGSGNASDAALVVNHLATFTVQILNRLITDRTTVVACRGSVTDHLRQLQGILPRGWPPGSTWDTVPGTFFPDTNEVVLAVVGHGTRLGPHVPAKGEGHGSEDVVLHETAHGFDMGGGQPFLSTDRDFITARNRDFTLISDYEKQPSPAGEQETFAESAARFFTRRDGNMANLHDFWASISDRLAEQEGVMAERAVGHRRMPADDLPEKTIGTALMSADGAVTLELRATGSGARGDALVSYQRGHPSYEAILRHLGGLVPNETKDILPFP
jgi:hypothetical protein